MYSKEIINRFIDEISSNYNISKNDLNHILEKTDDVSTFKQNLFEKKIEELRDICEMCGNIRTGNKKDLINRIQNTNNPYTPLYLRGTTSLKDMCRKYKLKLTGNKNALVLRLFSYINENNINITSGNLDINENTQQILEDDDQTVDEFIHKLCFSKDINYNVLKKRQLKECCRKKGLDQSGNKSELIKRLQNN